MSGGRLSGHVGPATEIDFLGFVIDTQAMEIRLPEEKLSRMKQLILSWRGKKGCSKRELLSLIGNLQHASAVVKPGRTFLRRMIDLSKRQVHLNSHLRLNVEFRADLQWWATFLDSWNGVAIISVLCRRPSMLSWFQMPQARGAVVRTWVTGGSLSRGRPVLLGQKCILVCRNCSLLLYLV